jgi:phytoene dehydrogenase-like protein
MAAHDESIENDLEQVEELLARGREGDGQRQRAYVQNADLVFRLLEHLTTHIRQTHATARQIEQLEQSMTRLSLLSQEATDQIEQATEVKTAYTAAAHPAQPHRHRWTIPVCPGCLRMIQPGEMVTLIHVGPGEHPEERAKAVAKQPYTPVTMAAHLACVTGHEDS